MKSNELQKFVKSLPKKMKAKRMTLPSRKGYEPGVRVAASDIGMASATYYRIEEGGIPDVPTLTKIMKWLEA